jgi:mannose-6-phosphate isomerase-like protein (cupin superfamily)
MRFPVKAGEKIGIKNTPLNGHSSVSKEACMYHLGKFDESKFAVPPRYEQHSQGYTRVTLVDHTVGSVHTGLGICQLRPGGKVKTCIQANEKGFYVLAGEIEIMRGKEAFRLGPDDYGLIPYGEHQSFRNMGDKTARWIEVQSPQPKPPERWQDTFFIGELQWPKEIVRPEIGDPGTRFLGHFQESKAGLGIQGLTVYRFMDQEFGAHHFFMMRGKLEVGGMRGTHDHTVEESYFVLSGEVDMEIEGKRHHLRPGDVAWTGVGTSHAFFHRGDVPWRWLETQAPQFPSQHGTRNYGVWEKLQK